ncbi:hypothetical protein [Pseudorhodobacter ferrugineus]|uniref:hypothetical protein n=1 Tax=Pseudorhodobacter ferrugineus TaxID=77008 RepID=UPI0003B3C839|nr:hypothetical protein [Pseudorhodobacter ferrugineus]
MKLMTQRILAASAALITLAGAGFAEPVTGKVAEKQVFSPTGSEVEMLPVAGLSPESAALLQQVVGDYAYYAAAAIAPDEDILKSEATMLVANHHSIEAASAAALAGCDKVRQGGSPCVVAAIVRPKGWEARALQLSVEGTVALVNDYGKKGERAMATSAQTGFFALAQGAGAQTAAVQACNDKGATDCAISVSDAE